MIIPYTTIHLLIYDLRGFCSSRELACIYLHDDILEDSSFFFGLDYALRSEWLIRISRR